MADKIALLFPGQGSQYPGMGKSLYEKFPEAREIIDQAGEILGFDLKNVLFNGSEEQLKETSVTQPAIFTVSAAAFKAFAARCPGALSRQAWTAGHSLGEYSALFAAGVFDFQTGLKLVKYRGSFIQEAARKNPGTMAAVIGVPAEELKKICSEIAAGGGCCEPVNFNCPGQIVAAGDQASIAQLLERVAALPGARGIPLSVSGAFHSSLVSEAARRMAEVLQPAPLSDARVPVMANCDARPTRKAAEVKDKLVRQIDHPVLWEDSIRGMIGEGAETFIELGPGKVLTGLLRKIDRRKKALNVEDEESLNKAVQECSAAGVA